MKKGIALSFAVFLVLCLSGIGHGAATVGIVSGTESMDDTVLHEEEYVLPLSNTYYHYGKLYDLNEDVYLSQPGNGCIVFAYNGVFQEEESYQYSWEVRWDPSPVEIPPIYSLPWNLWLEQPVPADPQRFIVCGYPYQPQSVPVPAAFWLLASGLLGLAGLRKKFKE